jgi:peptide/nickel transport system ATP-binding protein
VTKPVLEVENLQLEYHGRSNIVRSLDGVDLQVMSGEVVGVVGESGSGKSTLASAVGGLLARNSRRIAGDLRIDGNSVFEMTPAELRATRRSDIGFVFQNPISSLNPSSRVGRQLRQATDLSAGPLAEILHSVGLDDLERINRCYPHQLSGGMAQRVAIAMAVARQPKLLIADEPTSALDKSVSDRIMKLLVDLCREAGRAFIIFTHDLSVVEAWCDRVAVMYGGQVVEAAEPSQLFRQPAHPYALGLLNAAVSVSDSKAAGLRPIPGAPPVLEGRSHCCTFNPRCFAADERCTAARPHLRELGERHVACFRAEEVLNGLT